MKKITLLIALLFLINWKGNAQVLNQSANWPNVAWVLSGTYDPLSLISDPTISTNFSYDDDNAGSGSTDILNAESPVIDLTAAFSAGETLITVDYDYDYNLGNIFNLEYYDADAVSWVVWDAIPDNSSATSGWCAAIAIPTVTSSQLNILSFTAAQLSGFRYRFAYDASSTWGWGFCLSSPTIVSAMPPSCPDPTVLTATNISTISADLGWTENGSATIWDIEWGINGFSPTGTPTISGTTTNPYNLTGLTTNTAYDFYVRADCGGSGTSAWVGPFSFFTGYCIPSSTSASTYVNNFTTIGGATNISNLTSGFTVGGYYDGTAQNVVSFATGSFDFNADIVGGTAGFAIWIDWNNDLILDNLTEKVFNTISYGSGPFIGTITVPVGTPLGNYRMRVTTDWNASNPSNPCAAASRAEFEDYTVTVSAPPSCLAPSVLTATSITATTADLGWTENGAATTWEIEWDTTGFVQGTGTTVITTTNPHSLTGLTANTAYDFYVRAICGPADTSTWNGPYTFITLCTTIVTPWFDDVEAHTPSTTLVSSNCWDATATGAYGWDISGTGTTPSSGTGPLSAFSGTNFFFTEASVGSVGDIASLYSPNIDISALTVPTLEFSYHMFGTAIGDLFVDVFDGTWTTVDSIMGQQQNTQSDPWIIKSIDLSAFTNTIQIRFRAISAGTYTGDISIDDIRIYEPLPNDVGVISIVSTPTGCGLGMETVTVKVKNYGTSSETGFDVAYALNGTPVTPETVAGTVLPGDTLTHVFTTLANMTAPNTYVIDAWSLLPTDGDSSNDTLVGWSTEHITPSLTYNGSAAVSNTIANGTPTIICTNGLVNNMLDSCYYLSALVIDSLVHTWNSDIDMWLISPAGDTLEVSTDNGGSTDNYINVTFTDTALTYITGTNPIPGFYHTEDSLGLAKFNGTDPTGAWTLLVMDDTGGDDGTVYQWHLEFTDNNSPASTDTQVACNTYTWIDSVIYTTSNNTATYTFTNAAGCDSVVTLDLTINSIDNTVTQAGATLTANQTGATYVWIDCNNGNAVIAGATSQQYIATANGDYAVVVTINGCVDTSACANVTGVGINANSNNVNMNVYPNPSKGLFTLNVNTTDVNELEIKVINAQGQVVYAKTNFENISKVSEQIDLSNNAKGLYFITVTSDKGVITHKILVQ